MVAVLSVVAQMMDHFAIYLILHDKSILLVEWWAAGFVEVVLIGLSFFAGRIYEDGKHIEDILKKQGY